MPQDDPPNRNLDRYQELSRPDIKRILDERSVDPISEGRHPNSMVASGMEVNLNNQQLAQYLYSLGENVEVLRDAIQDGVAGGPGTQGPPGIPGADGTDGVDGVSFEFVFARTVGETPPALPDNSWGFETPGIDDQGSGTASALWFDSAPSLTADFPVLWQAQRTYPAETEVGDAVADDWSAPTIVGRFGRDGVPGSDGRDGTSGTTL